MNKISSVNNVFRNCNCFTGCESIPSRDSDFATIVSTASCVFHDIDSFGIHGDVFSINDAGFYLKNVDHVVSAHGNMVEVITDYRTKFRSSWEHRYKTHTAHFKDIGLPESQQVKASYQWSFDPMFYSSGVLAIFIAIALGYKAILVHGIPLG